MREIIQSAPRAGQVSAVRVTVGALANTTQPLMVLLPEQSKLRAPLCVPTRAIGFVAKGQEVRICYDAFPYQRFGVALELNPTQEFEQKDENQQIPPENLLAKNRWP